MNEFMNIPRRDMPDTRLSDPKPEPPEIEKVEGTGKTMKDFTPEKSFLQTLKQTVTNLYAMPKRIKPFITQKSTWEGIAAALGAIGIVIYPQAIVEIVAGVFGIIGGIELWKKEPEDE